MNTKLVLVLGAIAAVEGARPIAVTPGNDQAAVDPAMVRKINDAQLTWTAGESDFFKGMSASEAKGLFGTQMLSAEALAAVPVISHEAADLPDEFDARKQWPGFIHPIRNQAQCGSCWAFSASEALSDRFAIASNGTVNVVLSPQDAVSCDKPDNMGCQGGYLDKAWEYMTNTGLVTDDCMPYTSGTGDDGVCPNDKCTGAGNVTWFKYHAASYATFSSPEAIQTEIMTNGPVQAAFTVHKSFMAYTSGVYIHHPWEVWDPVEGGHAIKIVGWGEEKAGELNLSTKYWLVANSWTTSWGEEGFFKIKRGVNECGIESQVFAGPANVSP